MRKKCHSKVVHYFHPTDCSFEDYIGYTRKWKVGSPYLNEGIRINRSKSSSYIDRLQWNGGDHFIFVPEDFQYLENDIGMPCIFDLEAAKTYNKYRILSVSKYYQPNLEFINLQYMNKERKYVFVSLKHAPGIHCLNCGEPVLTIEEQDYLHALFKMDKIKGFSNGLEFIDFAVDIFKFPY